jgi:hypothetical protein
MAREMSQILFRAGQKIIETHDCVAFRQQAVAHVGADKTRRSGYDHTQRKRPPLKPLYCSNSFEQRSRMLV